MKVAVLGGGSFSVPILSAIADSAHSLVGVVSRPDSKGGRGRSIVSSPASRWALSHSVPLLKPERVSLRPFEESFRSLGAEVALVADFGEILKSFVFEWTEFGFYGVHPSLLPRWRGAAPIQWSILSGDRETGIMIFKVSSGVDSGSIVAVGKTDIGSRETAPELEERLAHMGARLAVKFIDELATGIPNLMRQDDTGLTKARRIRVDDGHLLWTDDAQSLDRRVRALLPWPCAWFETHGKRIRVLKAMAVDGIHEEPGIFLGLSDIDDLAGAAISCGSGTLILQTVQSPGKRPLAATDWLNGFRLKPGARIA